MFSQQGVSGASGSQWLASDGRRSTPVQVHPHFLKDSIKKDSTANNHVLKDSIKIDLILSLFYKFL